MSGRLYKCCCVPNCHNTREKDVILHVFPNPAKDRHRFQAWVQAVGLNVGELDEMAVFKHRRICHSHFEAKYYTISKRLSANAVPTLNLKVSPEYLKLSMCHCCQATERELHGVTANILETYKNVVGDSMVKDSPLFICIYCKAFLRKYIKFRIGCRQTQRVLEQAKANKGITINDLTANTLPVQYKQTETNLFSVNCIGQVTFDNLTYAQYDHPLGTQNEEEIHINDPNDSDDRYNGAQILNSELPVQENCLAKEEINHSDTSDRYHNPRNLNTELPVQKKSMAKKEKNIETIDNIERFEREFDVAISVLSFHEQMQDVLGRRLSKNYLQSPYKCELCYKGFMDEDILGRHVRAQHDVNRKVMCEYCKFRYRDKRALNQHLKSHRLKFSCRQCSYVSRTTFNAREHFKMHGGLLRRCAECGKSYEKLTSYLSHMRIHHPSELIWCDLCGEAFIRPFGLNAHKKRAHADLSLHHHCSQCDKSFASRHAADRHAQLCDCATNSQFACVHCGEGFEENLQLRNHLLHQHRVEKIFTCEKCGKSFKRESQYCAHFRQKHVTGPRDKPRLWVCEVCGKTLPNKCLLVYHQRNHTGERPYQCGQCPKRFTMKKLLQSHLRVHSSARPFSCSLCPKTFKGLSALRTHEHMHTQGRVRGHKKGDNRTTE